MPVGRELVSRAFCIGIERAAGQIVEQLVADHDVERAGRTVDESVRVGVHERDVDLERVGAVELGEQHNLLAIVSRRRLYAGHLLVVPALLRRRGRSLERDL